MEKFRTLDVLYGGRKPEPCACFASLTNGSPYARLDQENYVLERPLWPFDHDQK